MSSWLKVKPSLTVVCSSWEKWETAATPAAPKATVPKSKFSSGLVAGVALISVLNSLKFTSSTWGRSVATGASTADSTTGKSNAGVLRFKLLFCANSLTSKSKLKSSGVEASILLATASDSSSFCLSRLSKSSKLKSSLIGSGVAAGCAYWANSSSLGIKSCSLAVWAAAVTAAVPSNAVAAVAIVVSGATVGLAVDWWKAFSSCGSNEWSASSSASVNWLGADSVLLSVTLLVSKATSSKLKISTASSLVSSNTESPVNVAFLRERAINMASSNKATNPAAK